MFLPLFNNLARNPTYTFVFEVFHTFDYASSKEYRKEQIIYMNLECAARVVHLSTRIR